MIRKLQKKFISITAAALFAMILTVMAAVNGVFFYQTNKMLDSRLAQLMAEQDSFFPESDDREQQPKPLKDISGQFPEQPPVQEALSEQSPEQSLIPEALDRQPFSQTPAPADKWFLPQFEDRLKIRFDGCLVYLNENGEIQEIRQDGAENYSETELSEIASEIFRGEKDRGWHQYYKFCLETRELADGTTETVIGLINASSNLYSVFTMLLISGVIGVLSFLLVLLIIILASKQAVKPIAEGYIKQKQFITDAGHELKTPLTVISANNELSRMIYGESEWFDGIDKQVAKMNSLVRNLITLARLDEEQKPVFSSFSLSDAVYDTAKSFENLIHAQGRIITFDIAEDITYLGDESKLRQVVSILMDNAAKYCDEKGKIAVRLKSDRQIRLQVINDYSPTGDCDLEKVFERFYRADKARASDGSYGLGLSIAKSIVELHKGEIRAKALEHNRVMFEVILK